MIRVGLFLLLIAVSYSCKNESSQISSRKPDELVVEQRKDFIDFDFLEFVKNAHVGKEVVSGSEKEWLYYTTYLGDLEIGKKKYLVLTQDILMQFAITKHGKSKIIFIENQSKKCTIYCGMGQDELPLSIVENQLVFEFNGRKRYLTMEDSLMPLFCVPDDHGCY